MLCFLSVFLISPFVFMFFHWFLCLHLSSCFSFVFLSIFCLALWIFLQLSLTWLFKPAFSHISTLLYLQRKLVMNSFKITVKCCLGHFEKRTFKILVLECVFFCNLVSSQCMWHLGCRAASPYCCQIRLLQIMTRTSSAHHSCTMWIKCKFWKKQ